MMMFVNQLNVQMVLNGKLRHIDKGIRSYQLYLDHLFKVSNSEVHDLSFSVITAILCLYSAHL